MRNLALRSVVSSVGVGLLAMVAVGCASHMHSQAVDPEDLPKFAGHYVGSYVDAGGNSVPAVLDVDAKGNYKMTIIGSDITNSGKCSVVDGQVKCERTGRTGPSQDRAFASATVDVQEAPDGTISLAGFGRDDRGPLTVFFTRRGQPMKK